MGRLKPPFTCSYSGSREYSSTVYSTSIGPFPTLPFSDHNICITCLAGADSLDVPSDLALDFGMSAPPLRTDQFEIMSE